MTVAINGKKIFGPGRDWLISNTTNPTPARPYLVQDQSITFKREVKSIFGENQLAADVSSGQMTVNGKITFGATNARIFADQLFTDATVLATQTLESDNELGTIASHAITVANSVGWTVDLGVVNTTNGARYARVAPGSEAAGVSYSVLAGMYTFALGETGTTFKISYLYTPVAPVPTSGTITVANQKQGKVGASTAVMIFPWVNQAQVVETDILTLNLILVSDHELSTKGSDYGKPTLSFEAACDANDNLGTFAFAESA